MTQEPGPWPPGPQHALLSALDLHYNDVLSLDVFSVLALRIDGMFRRAFGLQSVQAAIARCRA